MLLNYFIVPGIINGDIVLLIRRYFHHYLKQYFISENNMLLELTYLNTFHSGVDPVWLTDAYLFQFFDFSSMIRLLGIPTIMLFATNVPLNEQQ